MGDIPVAHTSAVLQSQPESFRLKEPPTYTSTIPSLHTSTVTPPTTVAQMSKQLNRHQSIISAASDTLTTAFDTLIASNTTFTSSVKSYLQQACSAGFLQNTAVQSLPLQSPPHGTTNILSVRGDQTEELNVTISNHPLFTAVPPYYSSNSLVVTTLTAKQASDLRNLEAQVAATSGPRIADRIGLLYYTSNTTPSQGLSLVAGNTYDRLHTLNFLIDNGSQLNVINANDVLQILPTIKWEDYVATLAFQPVGSSPLSPTASLPAGVINLVFKFDSDDQTIIQLEWTVISGPDKRGTPIIGNSVFHKLEADWSSNRSNSDHGSMLSYTTHQGLRGQLPLLYTVHRQLPPDSRDTLSSSNATSAEDWFEDNE
jgi:hypothetical protein